MRLQILKSALVSRRQSGAGKQNFRLLVTANTLAIITVIIVFIFLILLSRNNVKLREEKTKLVSTVATMSGTIAGSPSIQIGDIVPPFKTLNLEGKPGDIIYDGSTKYLLYIFSTGCGVCMDQFPNWNLLASRAKLKNTKVIGLSIDSEQTKAKLSKIDRNFEVLLMPNKPIQRAYRVVAVPLVLVVSSQGNIEWEHYGTLSDDNIKEISSLLDFEL